MRTYFLWCSSLSKANISSENTEFQQFRGLMLPTSMKLTQTFVVAVGAVFCHGTVPQGPQTTWGNLIGWHILAYIIVESKTILLYSGATF